jgi:hypothetical protein
MNCEEDKMKNARDIRAFFSEARERMNKQHRETITALNRAEDAAVDAFELGRRFVSLGEGMAKRLADKVGEEASDAESKG